MKRIILILILTALLTDCNMDHSSSHRYTNHLIHETSPYLLQHAHNPVDWYAWGEEAFEKARKEDKLILVSIGYSSCHWCHVMEHESFEDEVTAQLMNENFVCIKVDREERPDIDQVYMHAVQLLTGSGGWPLNCFILPDGKPMYGGTYFRTAQWQHILRSLIDLYKNEKTRVVAYANELAEGINKSELIKLNPEAAVFSIKTLEDAIEKWSGYFDNIEGGPNRAPKFPLPDNYQFLLRYAVMTRDEKLLHHVNLTLTKMAYGGIYDQVGGGFARYSTDSLWKAPHFEKMLYDNAQLISLYSEAYRATKNPLYKKVVYETVRFIEREMTSSEGVFYSALDADSEGEEGKYYVWKKEELEKVISGINSSITDKEKQWEIVKAYFNINEKGLWEHGNYILLHNKTDEEIATQFSISEEQLSQLISETKKALLNEREKRTRPGLDDKSLTSWNALMITGLCDAYNAFDEKHFIDMALQNADFILQKQWIKKEALQHSYKNGKSSINGFLEDYAFTIEAFINLYQSTFDESWLLKADQLIHYTLKHFHNKESSLFYFTSDLDPALIARKTEINDNVIPASNSAMAKSIFLVGYYLDRPDYTDLAKTMLNQVQKDFISYPAGYSNWMKLHLWLTQSFYEIVITGNDANQKRKEFFDYYYPNCLLAGSTSKSNLSIFENRFVGAKTLIYVCKDKACLLPVENTGDYIKNLLPD